MIASGRRSHVGDSMVEPDTSRLRANRRRRRWTPAEGGNAVLARSAIGRAAALKRVDSTNFT